ncbi:hypothetical protein DFH08DRAFT_1088107 [Mycena albidolilacea]|uniref:Uncharacterized protein n=1 Tax=Mycena albidolilacea TaxID=1033008 RepID=A0AAD6Z805_9AGAR|nr:hypothetical protein DFH08DRAFT_1088107 [Mycena albidolilacea]
MEKCCNDAMQKLKNGCVVCWARGFHNWNTDFYNNCKEPCIHDSDDGWNAFKNAFEMGGGWCWGCLMPQKKKGGSHIFTTNCEVRNIMKPAVYAYAMHNKKRPGVSECPVVSNGALASSPVGILLTGATATPAHFAAWCLLEQPQPPPFINVHHLFLWLIFQRKLLPVPPELAQFFL